ncbi:MAG: flagellar assembly protein FliW [Bryobacteraceae bacterium]
MPAFETQQLGTIIYDPDAAIEFPHGLPGFDHLHQFAAVRLPKTDPLVYLQSLEDPAVCFLTAPVAAVCPDYRLEVSAEDLEAVGLAAARRPAIGRDVLCLAVLSLREGGPRANLLAPVVVNLRNRKAVQAVSPRGDYSHQYALAPEEAAVCS